MSYSVPKCCLSCYNRECGEDENSGRQLTATGLVPFSYCLLNIWFPTKKQTCKRCRPMKDEILALCLGGILGVAVGAIVIGAVAVLSLVVE